MNINDIYTSNSTYLKSQDLEAGKEFRVVISGTEMADLDNKKKIVLKFEGHEKGLVLNKTNAMTIAHVNGDETSQWIGKAVFIFSTMVDYAGKQVPSIRVRAEMQQAQMQRPIQTNNQPNPANQQPAGRFEDFDQDIPFG